MPKGPPRDPAKLKLLKKTGRKDRMTENVPEPDEMDSCPDPPDHLMDYAKEIWNDLGPDLVELGLLTSVDLLAFRALCVHYGMMVEAEHEMSKGALIEGQRGSVKNPAAQIYRDNSIQFRQYCGLFGIDPADRSKVSAKPKKKDENPYSKLGS